MDRRGPLTRTGAVHRAVLAATVAFAGAVLAVPAPASAAPVVRWVDVTVATLWSAPGATRAVDAPALANPADPRRWVASMSDSQKRWLSLGHSQTQALYGTRVRVTATSGRWSKVVVPSQPSPKDRRGYPGWLPTRQLTTAAPPASGTTAVVSGRTAWLWADDDSVGTRPGKVRELSYGTSLPVVSAGARLVHVGMLGRRRRAPCGGRRSSSAPDRTRPRPVPPSSTRRCASSACPTCGRARAASGSTARA